MKKTMRTVVASLLLFIMLFSISATAISAAGGVGSGDVSSGDIGTLDPVVGESTPTSGSVDFGWCSISYEISDAGNSIDFIWYHNLEAMFEAKPEHIKLLASTLLEGVGKIIIESLTVDDTAPGEGFDASITKDNIWDKALDAFLDSEYGAHDEATSFEFFKDLFADDGTLMVEFASYACDLLDTAVKADVIALDDVLATVPDGAAIKPVVVDMFEAKLSAYADNKDDMALVFGLISSSEIDDTLDTLADFVASEYDATVTELKNNPDSEITPADILEYLRSVNVNGNSVCTTVDGKLTFSLDAVKALLSELPKPETLANMSNDEMAWTWTVDIVTDLASTSFDLNLSVGAGYDGVRAVAQAISEFIGVSKAEDGTVLVTLNFPESLSGALLSVLNAPLTEVPKELKEDIFELMNGSLSDVLAYIQNDLTYESYIAILNSADIQSLLEDFAITGFENEEIRALFGSDFYYNKLKSVVNKLAPNLPEELKAESLPDLYQGNGKFNYLGDFSISPSVLLESFDIGALTSVANMLDGMTFDLKLDLTVNVPALSEVQYFIKDSTIDEDVFIKKGFLPAGADLAFFFGPDRYKGYKIVSWTDAEGTEYTEMPTADVALYGILEELDVTAESDVSAVYDEATDYTLEAFVAYNQTAPQYIYQWYKDGAPIAGATAKTLTVKNVADSGVYYCEVVIVDGDLNATEKTNNVTVSITPKPMDIAGFGITWDYQGPFTFAENTERKVLSSVTSTIIALDRYENNAKVNAGNYTAVAYYKIIDGNYCFAGGVNYVTLAWDIVRAQLSDTSEFVWSYIPGETVLTYKLGEVKRVTLTLPANLAATYTGETASQVGDYTAVATIYSTNPNYDWTGVNTVSLDWSIKKADVDLSALKWSYDAENAPVYSGEEYKVSLLDVPADIIWLYAENAKTGAGEYTATAEPDPNAVANNNYNFIGSVPACAWKVAKATISASAVANWSYTDAFIYDGTEKKVEFILPENFAEGVTVAYENNTATDAGTYKAKATLVAQDADNFAVVGESVEFTLDWTINRAVLDLSGIKFRNTTVTYNGLPQSIEIEGILPAGVGVEYSAAQVEPGTYEMTATIIVNELNYEPVAPMVAELTILPVYDIDKDFNYTDSDGKTIVDVSAVNGIPNNHVLNVKDLTLSYTDFDFGNFFGVGKTGKIYSAYDLHFTVEGIENPVSDIFNVKLAIPENFDGDINNLRVVYIDDNGHLTDMEAIIDGDNIAFETYHFSVYAIVEIVDAPEEVTPVDLTWLWILLAVIAVAAVVVAIVIIVLKKKGGKKPPEAPKSDDGNEPTEPEDDASSEEASEEPAEEKTEAVEEATSEEAVAEDAVEESTEDEAPADENVEEEPAEEAPAAEETFEEPVAEIAEEPAAEEAVEETVTEEAACEEEEKKSSIVIHEELEDAQAAAAALPITTEIVNVRCRTSFMSRLIQSEPPIQDYYNILKNALLSYKGVKARMSWNFESFNKGRTQCAKLNVKGRNFLVYLALNLEDYNVNKYHFTDASDKPKFENVPMMLKIKSERSLKYALELIDEVMKKNGFEKTKAQEVDYHMPYMTTAELAERELVKLILPAGVTLAEGIMLVKSDVGAIIDEANAQAAEEKGED